MPIDTSIPESPGWWVQRLSRKLEARTRERLTLLDAYHRGDPPLPVGAENARSAYQAFQRKARLNLAELSVETVRERMTPTGILTGAGADETGDQQAWLWWQSAGMDVKVADVFESMLALGDGYMIVGLDEDDEPVITAEDPRQVVTEHDPLDQRKVRAALKLFHDPVAEADFAYLFLPGELHVATRRRRSLRVSPQRFAPISWDWDEERSKEYGPGLEDFMPVVRFRNKRGIGEFEQHLDVLDRVNHGLLQRMVITTMQAFKQRALKGDLPETYPDGHPQAGEPIDYDAIFVADPGALWMIPGAADIWESGQTDIRPIIESVMADIQHFCAVTRSFVPMFQTDAANQTAEGAASAREGLVFRAEDRIMRAKDGLIDVLSLAFRLKGDDERAVRDQLGILWAPVERRSLAERADAASKAAADMDIETRLIEIWQFSPQHARQVARKKAAELAAATPPDLPAA